MQNSKINISKIIIYMYRFITVFMSMLITLLFTKLLLESKESNTKDDTKDVILNFDNEKIKCKCDINNSNKEVKEKFTNYTKEAEININPPDIDDNLITSIDDLDMPKHNNITAESYYKNNFRYPIEPLDESSNEINSFNEYKYLNIGKDTDKVIKNIKTI